MSLSTKLHRAPLRFVTGAFILNSGLTKARADDDTAKALHATASNAYPLLRNVEPRTFLKGLVTWEIALGSALLLPIVPAGVAGLALTGFAGGLLGTWWRTPGMREPGSLRPTQQGTAIAKDVWMLGIGTGLVIDALSERRARRSERD